MRARHGHSNKETAGTSSGEEKGGQAKPEAGAHQEAEKARRHGSLGPGLREGWRLAQGAESVLYRLSSLGLQPHHLWLLLIVQAGRFEDHPTRFYWENLARACGRDKSTVRRWTSELKKKGLLQIKQNRGRDPGDDRVGVRNESNSFFVDGLVTRCDQEQLDWEEEKKERNRGRRKKKT
jgi:hypothetical protein